MAASLDEQALRSALVALADAIPADAATLDKSQIRALHLTQRLSRLASLNGSFPRALAALGDCLASPGQVTIDAIDPELVPVRAHTQEALTFSAATLAWSVPVSQGFGRRLRFLVRDRANGKVVGLIGLTDPVFNLRPRDAWVGWSAEERKERLVNVMDAFVLGALPPYNAILGGKLVALLAASREVCRTFRARYGASEGTISGRSKDPKLVLVTTTSALGRSSVYNRLSLPGGVEYIGRAGGECSEPWFTQGYGHFHIPDHLFAQMRELLASRKHPYAKGNRFGDGPNWKIRVIRRTAVELGFPPDFLRHGIRRQVYLVPLAHNTRSFLLGQSRAPRYRTWSVADITDYWRKRWAGPRAARLPDWSTWDPSVLLFELESLQRRAATEGGI